MPLISVIVPVYKVENVLNYCIDSILNQTYKDFELILVDDGSPDNSGKICDEYAKKDNRIKVIHKENGGVSSARNCGIDAAKGKYICFVDSDDYPCINYLLDMINMCKKFDGCDLLLGGFNVVSDYKSNIEKKVLFTEDHNYSCVSRLDFIRMYEKWVIQMPWNKLYKLKIIKTSKIRFDENLSLGEDILFNIDYLTNSNGNIAILNKPIYNYTRTGIESLDNKYYPDLKSIYDRIYERIFEFCDEFNLSNTDIQHMYASYFYSIENVLKNTFSEKNKAGVSLKYRYNNEILRSKQFKNILKRSKKFVNWKLRLIYSMRYYRIVNICNSIMNRLH